MAADRAAELTEAYRILIDAGRRAEYDRAFADAGGAPAPSAAAGGRRARRRRPARRRRQRLRRRRPPRPPARLRSAASSRQERATPRRVRAQGDARAASARRWPPCGGGYDETQLRGFDLALRAEEAKLFGRSKSPRLLGRFVVARGSRRRSPTPGRRPLKWSADGRRGLRLADGHRRWRPPRELAGAIAEQRRKARGAKVTLIPVDARDWDAHIPLDAPAVAKNLLARLKSGT